MVFPAVVTVWLCAGGAQALHQALALEEAGNDRAALRQVELVVERRPSFDLARLEAARLRLKTGEGLDEAGTHLARAKALAPTNPRVHYLEGLLFQETGRERDACASLEQALQHRADYDEARVRLAGLYFALEDWPRAEAHYRTLARARGPNQLNAGLQLAQVLERQGRLEDSELELRRLYHANPGALLVGRRLAEFYERTGREELARKTREESGQSPERRRLRPLRRSRR